MRYLLVILLVLAGCTQPVTPSPSPSSSTPSVEPPTPTPSPVCSPMGGTPRPCSAEEFEKTQEQNRLTEEAIALYRRWTKESTRLYRAGGTSKPTKEMLATTAGDFRSSALGVYRGVKASGVKATSGTIEIVRIGVDSTVVVTPGEAAISACMDGTSLWFERAGRKIRRGIIFAEYFVAKVIDRQLRLWKVSSEVLEKC